jgi:xRRM domain
MAEQVLGKREEIYWAKVPEKIRRQAVEKAISSRCCDTDSTLTAGPSMADTKKKRAIEEHQTHSVDLNIHVNSAYPPGCLVFIRNVHPETNKTTLRNLFLHAREETVESGDSGGKKDEDGIDYLDYTKGMDCVCLFLFFAFVSKF